MTPGAAGLLQRAGAALGAALRQRLFDIDALEATFARRGFAGAEPDVQEHLEHIGRVFIGGYAAAIDCCAVEAARDHLERVPPAFRGFAYEGAAMAFTLLEALWPRSRITLRAFLDGPAAPHRYMVFVGAGWAMARARCVSAERLRSLDPLLFWLAHDGHGFHEGYFHADRSIGKTMRPRRLSGYAARAFDQGLGRSLWFVSGADVERVAAHIASFAMERRVDLWAGAGLAAAYAGGAAPSACGRLRELAGPHRAALAQGAAFAAEARSRAAITVPWTVAATEALCGVPFLRAVEIVRAAAEGLPSGGDVPEYEVWRRRVQTLLASSAS